MVRSITPTPSVQFIHTVHVNACLYTFTYTFDIYYQTNICMGDSHFYQSNILRQYLHVHSSIFWGYCKSRKMWWFLPYSWLFKPFSTLMNCTHIISTVWSQCSRHDTKATEKATDRMSCHCFCEQRQLSAICRGDESSQHRNQLDSIKRLNPTAARSCPQTDLSSWVTSDMTCEDGSHDWLGCLLRTRSTRSRCRENGF